MGPDRPWSLALREAPSVRDTNRYGSIGTTTTRLEAPCEAGTGATIPAHRRAPRRECRGARGRGYVVAVGKAGNRGNRAKRKCGDGSAPRRCAQAINQRLSVLPNLSPDPDVAAGACGFVRLPMAAGVRADAGHGSSPLARPRENARAGHCRGRDRSARAGDRGYPPAKPHGGRAPCRALSGALGAARPMG